MICRPLARKVEEVHPVGLERVAGARREPLGGEDRRGEVVGADLMEVRRVVARHDKRVSARYRVDVHEAHGAFVRVDDRPR